MIIKHYSPQKHKSLNCDSICKGCDLCILKKFNGLEYRTSAMSVFESFSNKEILDLIEGQQKAIKQECEMHVKYGWMSEAIKEKTLKQYSLFFFFENHFYNIGELKFWISERDRSERTVVSPPMMSRNSEMQSNIVGVNREAIRNITGYTYNPIPAWDELKRPVYVEWQHRLLEDEHDLVIVNGSRQMGKSFTISQKLIECSFLPNNDTLVGAFLVSTTNVIRNYCRKLIRKFPEGMFEYKAGERYLINLETGTKIYFRTLGDDAQNILGLTLKRVIVDEAQLISQFVFEEVLEPTLSTTGGQMIMIGTPGRKRSGYMFDKITQYKKGMLPDASFYEVDVTKNPFIAPKKRAYIMANKHEYAIRRQWFCEWSDGSDGLFPFRKCHKLPDSMEFGYLVLGLDPARINDRSSYCLNHVYEGKIYGSFSGFVPDAFKKDWQLQAKFYINMISAFKDNPNFYIGMDITGVGDGVLKIFRNEGLKIDFTARYTGSGGDPNIKDATEFKVGKSYLINTAVDFMQEGTYEIYAPTNSDLMEEISYAVEDRNSKGMIQMDTTFYDDTINAMMISLLYIKQRNLVSRSMENTPSFETSGVRHIDVFDGMQYGEEEVSHVW